MRPLIGTFLLGLALVGCDSSPQADTGKAKTPQAAAGPEAKIDRTQAGKPAPAVQFASRDGKSFSVADFRGRPVLVNLWATWCAPCITEMPALDRLAAREGDKLTVLAVSQDMEGWKAVDGFFTPGKFKALVPYLDQKTDYALAIGAKGLPVSILYDADGKERWRVNGPLEWDGPEVAGLLRQTPLPSRGRG